MATSRFDVERALLRSELPPGCRHLVHVLCTYVDAEAGVILSKFQPSITQLARDTGRNRRTIIRYLAVLERWEWITRKRPTKADQRKKHARTQYTVRIGKSPQAGDITSPGLVTESPGASDGMSPELVTPRPEARGAMPHQSSRSSRSSTAEIEAVIEAIKGSTGKTVDERWAARVADQILGARDRVRDPAAVIHATIRRAPRDTYLPTPAPPRFTKARGFEQLFREKSMRTMRDSLDREVAFQAQDGLVLIQVTPHSGMHGRIMLATPEQQREFGRLWSETRAEAAAAGE